MIFLCYIGSYMYSVPQEIHKPSTRNSHIHHKFLSSEVSREKREKTSWLPLSFTILQLHQDVMLFVQWLS